MPCRSAWPDGEDQAMARPVNVGRTDQVVRRRSDMPGEPPAKQPLQPGQPDGTEPGDTRVTPDSGGRGTRSNRRSRPRRKGAAE